MGRFGPGVIVPFKLIFYRILIKIHKEFICHMKLKISFEVLPFHEFLPSVLPLCLTFRFSKKATENQQIGRFGFFGLLRVSQIYLVCISTYFSVVNLLCFDHEKRIRLSLRKSK